MFCSTLRVDFCFMGSLDAGLDFKPSSLKSSLSSLSFWLGWVKSLSPAKMEFAPARKQSA